MILTYVPEKKIMEVGKNYVGGCGRIREQNNHHPTTNPPKIDDVG